MAYEMGQGGLAFERQVTLPLVYREITVPNAYRLDLVVERKVIIEVKAVAALTPVFEAQLLTYLRLTGLRVGLILNFNVPLLKDGIVRRVS